MQTARLKIEVQRNPSQMAFYRIDAGVYEILRHEPYTGADHEFAERDGWYHVRTPMAEIRRLPVRLFDAD